MEFEEKQDAFQHLEPDGVLDVSNGQSSSFNYKEDNGTSAENTKNTIYLKSMKILPLSYDDEQKLISDIQGTKAFNHILPEKRKFGKLKDGSSKKYKVDHSIARKIQNLNERFTHVSVFVQETDDIFSLQVLTTLTITFVRTCSYIYLYISSEWKNLDPNAGLSIVTQIFFDFLAFGSVAIHASFVTEEAKKFAPLIIRLPRIGKTKEIRTLLQSEIAVLTAYATNVQLTAWKFFTVSRNFIPTVIGVTTTYIIVILQLYQVIQDSKCMQKSG
ncbi:uncharacterized protein CDAR_617471 [Caerostris darwini]|uniref:Gustatory receptor n=1 Tax=Caerostris darwini TaxID=1538125 RepID=A0AAV4VQQ6_9ARAC|nr:uncharacterized protein CDAR_617471 [Caerostris darwini]